MRGQKFIRSAIILFPKHLNFFYVLVLWSQVRTSHRLGKQYGCKGTPKSTSTVPHSHLCESLHPWPACSTADSSRFDGHLLSSPFLDHRSQVVNFILVCISQAEIEPRSSHMVGKCSILSSLPNSLLVLNNRTWQT